MPLYANYKKLGWNNSCCYASLLSRIFSCFLSLCVTTISMRYTHLLAVHKWRHASGGRGFHTFVTLFKKTQIKQAIKCDIGGKGVQYYN